jgi:hypothetical protein
MASPSPTPRRDGLASRWHVLLHALALVAGWGLFAGSWWLVLDQPRDTADLRHLILGAVIVMPAITLTWIAHNLGIYRRKGPRRAVAPVPLRYDVDFNGRRIEADWPALQNARTVVIERGDGVKRYVSRPQPQTPPPRPAPTRPAVEHGDFELTES